MKGRDIKRSFVFEFRAVSNVFLYLYIMRNEFTSLVTLSIGSVFLAVVLLLVDRLHSFLARWSDRMGSVGRVVLV